MSSIESQHNGGKTPKRPKRLGRLRRSGRPISESLSEPLATWGPGIEWVAPGTLSDHLVWRVLLDFASSEEEEALTASVREHKVIYPLLVTGDDCASPPGTILQGHRVRRAAMDARIPLVPAIRRHDLTREAEEEIIIKSALASQHVRKLTQSKIYALEERLHDLYSRRGQGFRSDLPTSVGTNGCSPPAGDTLTIVAQEAAASRNAVANRRKVFGSLISPEVLRAAVDDGTLSLTKAATLVREIETDATVRQALRAADPDAEVIALATATLDAAVRKQLGKPARRPRPRKQPVPEARGLLERDEYGLIGTAPFRGRLVKLFVTKDLALFYLEDSGPVAPPLPMTPRDEEVLRLDTFGDALKEIVSELPGGLVTVEAYDVSAPGSPNGLASATLSIRANDVAQPPISVEFHWWPASGDASNGIEATPSRTWPEGYAGRILGRPSRHQFGLALKAFLSYRVLRHTHGPVTAAAILNGPVAHPPLLSPSSFPLSAEPPEHDVQRID